jgi:aerobic-type carbon monoxide dehydrogenase small subunit (CoxS/CutS family)
MNVLLSINGHEHRLDLDVRMTLLDVLRERGQRKICSCLSANGVRSRNTHSHAGASS